MTTGNSTTAIVVSDMAISNYTKPLDINDNITLFDITGIHSLHAYQKGIPLVILLIGTMLNGLVICLTMQRSQFHHGYMYVKSAYALIDMFFLWAIIPPVLILRFTPETNLRHLCLYSNLGKGLFFAQSQIMTLIAIERYFFFCRPMIYERMFSLKNISITTFILVIISLIYTFTYEVLYPRQMNPVVPICQLKDERHSLLQIFLFFMPSVCAIWFSKIKIWRLLKQLERQNHVLPKTLNSDSEPRLRLKAVRIGLR